MNKSDTIGKLSKALTAVQAAIRPAIKDADNPFFKSKYADLNSVWDTARELLAKNGLAVIQGNSVGLDNTVIVETMLSHESGEWIQSSLCLPLAKHDPQGVGSAITYGRRYGLSAIVGIVADVDDDANAASGNGHPQPRRDPIKLQPKQNETERLKAVVWAAAKELGMDINALNNFSKTEYGKEMVSLSDEQLSNISIKLSKELTAKAAKAGAK